MKPEREKGIDKMLNERYTKIMNECLKDGLEMGIDFKKLMPPGWRLYPQIECCNRKTAVAICIYNYRYKLCTIQYSKKYEKLPNAMVKDTIMHELIHVIHGCNNHGKLFKLYMREINSHKEFGYNVVTSVRGELADKVHQICAGESPKKIYPIHKNYATLPPYMVERLNGIKMANGRLKVTKLKEIIIRLIDNKEFNMIDCIIRSYTKDFLACKRYLGKKNIAKIAQA